MAPESENKEAQKIVNIREHINKINIFAGILYEYINNERGAIERVNEDLNFAKGRLKKEIAEIRKLQDRLKRNRIVMEQAKTVLKKQYKVDLDALETAEEL